MSNKNLGYRFARGGENELEEAIDHYGESLLRYAMAILCDYHGAEDIVQEVFLSAYKNRATFDGGNLSAWLYKITYNRCLNQLKKRKILYFSEIRSEVIFPEDEGLSNEVLYALQKLKPEERALIYGRVIEEQSYKELSFLTGRSPAALRKQYERAKNKLTGYLNQEDHRRELEHE